MDAALDQDAGARGARDGRDHHQRRGKTEFRRRRENHQGDDGPHIARDDVDNNQKHEYHRDQPRRHLVRQLLHRRLLGLRAFHQRDDAGESGVGAQPFGPYVQRSRLDHGAGEHRRVDILVLWHTFAGDRRLVDRTLPAHHPAIDRNFLARPHQHDIANLQRTDKHRRLTARASYQRHLRHRADQRLDRGPGAVGVEFGNELGDQDDDHQHRPRHGFASEHSDQGCDGDEDLGADLALVDQVMPSGLHQRIQAHRDRHPQQLDRDETAPEKQRNKAGDNDTRHLDPAFARHQRHPIRRAGIPRQDPGLRCITIHPDSEKVACQPLRTALSANQN